MQSRSFMRACVVVVSLGVAGEPAWGSGFQLYNEGSAEALGFGGAVGARTDMVSNAWYNPASLAGYPHTELMLGTTLVVIQSEYKDTRAPGLDSSMEEGIVPIPHLYYVHPIDESLTAMLSLNAPYGMVTEWPEGWAGQYLATDTALQTLYATPSLAWKVNDKLSLAAGANLVWVDAVLTSWIPTTGMGLGYDTKRTLEADDYGFGGSVSASYQLSEAWQVAARYQSSVDLDLEGEARFTPQTAAAGLIDFDAEASLELPSSLSFGVANTSFERWTFGVELIWTEWSTYDAITIYRKDNGALASNTPKDWSDVWSLRLGAEYQIDERWCVRAGYVFDESPVPDRTRAPEMPGEDRHMWSLGLGYETERWAVDVAYSLLLILEADVGATGQADYGVDFLDPNGTYHDGYVHLIGASVRYRF